MSEDLYRQAAGLFRLVRDLDDSLNSRPSDPFGTARAERVWTQLLQAVIAAGKALPAEPSPLADWIRELGREAKQFDELVQKHGMQAIVSRFNVPGFGRLTDSGERLLRELKPKPVDPFAFIEPPTEALHPNAAPPSTSAPPNGTQQGEGEKPKPAATTEAILPALLSASDIAARINRKRESVTSFLTRFAEKYPDCRVENPSKRKNEPGYLYRTADVWPALEKWMKGNGEG